MPEMKKHIEILKNEEASIEDKRKAAKALGDFGNKAVPHLNEALWTMDEELKQNSIDSLTKIGTNKAFKVLVKELLKTEWSMVHVNEAYTGWVRQYERMENEKAALKDALGNFDQDEVANELMKFFNDEDHRERVIKLLGEFPSSEGLKALIRSHEDAKDDEIRNIIEEAIEEIAGKKNG